MIVDDAALASAISACAKGEEKALRRLYDAEAARMLGIANRLLRRPALAEEAVHDAFLSIWTKAASYEPAFGSPRAWMYAIVRNRALNILRGESRVDLEEDMGKYEDVSPGEEADDIFSRLSDSGALKRCLDGLDEKRREAVILAHAHGLTHGELAARLGVPLGTLKSWIRRSLLQLRECLQ
jgi:RNA polymerase sigma-70 factor (ECF subfamily)